MIKLICVIDDDGNAEMELDTGTDIDDTGLRALKRIKHLIKEAIKQVQKSAQGHVQMLH